MDPNNKKTLPAKKVFDTIMDDYKLDVKPIAETDSPEVKRIKYELQNLNFIQEEINKHLK